jgi:hypothetical protein
MADKSRQEFLAKASAQLVASIGEKKDASQARAHPTPEQLEEKEQEKLRKWANRYPPLRKPPVDFDALERAQKAQRAKKEGKPLPSQIIMNASRPLQPGDVLP